MNQTDNAQGAHTHNLLQTAHDTHIQNTHMHTQLPPHHEHD